jgi:hypothetical protein
MTSHWSVQQIRMATGADQVWVFDGKYYVVLVGLLFLWGMLFLNLMKASGLQSVASSLAFQFCVISAAAVSILPTTILLPGFHHSLVYMAERMSLGVGICVCALLAAARPQAFQRYALALVAVVFFGFLYRDEKILNVIEDRMDGVISRLPAGQRIVSGVDDPDLHTFAEAEKPYVTARYGDSWAMRTGNCVVQGGDLRLPQLIADQGGRIAVRYWKAGAPC